MHETDPGFEALLSSPKESGGFDFTGCKRSMVAAEPSGSMIRVRSAGCASGEEAYTPAVVLAEMPGADRFEDRVKIYEARRASYGEREVQVLPPPLVEKYLWNRHAEDLWGLRSAEVTGRHFLDLDIGSPVDRVRPLLRAALGDDGRSGTPASTRSTAGDGPSPSGWPAPRCGTAPAPRTGSTGPSS